jgi:hypothetical protein
MPEQPYPILRSHVDRKADDFQRNHGRPAAARSTTPRHKEAGKLLPRERIELLLDRDSHFLELCALAGTDIGATPPARAWSAASAWSRRRVRDHRERSHREGRRDQRVGVS